VKNTPTNITLRLKQIVVFFKICFWSFRHLTNGLFLYWYSLKILAVSVAVGASWWLCYQLWRLEQWSEKQE